MKKKGSVIMGLMVVLAVALPAVLTSSNAMADTTIWSDNFESYSLNAFPGSGGWQLITNGAGTAYQYVSDTHAVSGSRSMHLMGSNCWSATAYRPVGIPAKVKVEASIYLDAISCGCDQILAVIGLGTLGTHLGAVYFNCDGYMYAGRLNSDRSKDVRLMTYAASTWYKVKLIVDLNARTYDVYIDGVLRGSDIQIFDTETPTGVIVSAAHGTNPVAWFDDVSVSSIDVCDCDLNHDGRCDMRDWLVFGRKWGATNCSTSGLRVVEYGPLNGSSGVPTNGPIYVLFSEDINPSTLNSSTFFINGVSGTLTLNYGKWAIFTPSAGLDALTTYTVTLTTGITGVSGAHLSSNMNWVFTTYYPWLP